MRALRVEAILAVQRSLQRSAVEALATLRLGLRDDGLRSYCECLCGQRPVWWQLTSRRGLSRDSSYASCRPFGSRARYAQHDEERERGRHL